MLLNVNEGSLTNKLLKKVFLLLAGILLFPFPAVHPDNGVAFADDLPQYHTPLAGEPCTIECLGRCVAVPPRNRDNTAALVLGGTLFTPNLAGHDFLPMAAVYWKHRWGDTRVRGTFSVFVNELDASQTLGKFQLLGHLDNNTIPFSSAEIERGVEVEGTSIKRGEVNGRVGVGVRLPVAPFQTDNDLRLQLFYQAGYLYSKRVEDTAPNVVLPPDTMMHGALLRMRYDGMHRNLMELPHRGVAAGVDAQFMRRSNWSDANYGGAVYTKGETQDYLKVSGYLTAATGVPFLSEKNRLLFSVYGGFAPYGTLDRFSAFRIGGGPIPSETDDLDRQVFPGAMFSQFPASDYLIGAVEYRRELFPFLYLHLRGTYAWVKQNIFTDENRKFLAGSGEALSAGFTTGCLWNSELHLEYTYDTRILRNGTPGSNISLLWSKAF